MTKLGQMLVDDGNKRGKLQGALGWGQTPGAVAVMLAIGVREV